LLAVATLLALGPEFGHPATATATGPSVAPGYHLSVFAQGTSSYLNPDSIERDAARGVVYVGYQNITAKDGTDNKTSTIVEYTDSGAVVHTFSVLGHVDGLRVDPTTHLVWATSNEDGNPRLVTIDTTSGTITPYTFPTPPHGGGYDDLAFVDGKAFIAASNPTLNAAGVNVFPALDTVTLSNGQVMLTPVLQGNATATDRVTDRPVTLNLTDPDSLSVDRQGNLVLDSQGDGELVFLHNPGRPQQTVSALPLSDQVDDTVWVTSHAGRLLVVDAPNNVIYQVTIDGKWQVGTVYTEAPSDSPTPGIVGLLDSHTGQIAPIITGLGSPTGLLFAGDDHP
jgi:hypothetical protein